MPNPPVPGQDQHQEDERNEEELDHEIQEQGGEPVLTQEQIDALLDRPG